MSAAIAVVAAPIAYLVLRALLRSGVGSRIVAVPSGERWHDRATPTFGGVGIFAGFAAGAGLALAIAAVHGSGELWGILGGCALLFAAGLIDDVRHLPPLAKLVAQFGAAAMVVSSGLRVEVIGNDVLAVGIALIWLVGITNAFNLLDNMDGVWRRRSRRSPVRLLRDRRGHGASEPRRARARARTGVRVPRLPAAQPSAGKLGRAIR